jgi:hypothetical protein
VKSFKVKFVPDADVGKLENHLRRIAQTRVFVVRWQKLLKNDSGFQILFKKYKKK